MNTNISMTDIMTPEKRMGLSKTEHIPHCTYSLKWTHNVRYKRKGRSDSFLLVVTI